MQWLQSRVHTGARCPRLCLVPGHRNRTRILAWVCFKKEFVHISAQRVPYFGTKCERCIYFTFPRATEKIGHVYRHAGYLFHWYWIPILIKQNSFLCRYKNWSFLVFCIRRQTDIFRFILIYLIIASYVPEGKRKKPLFEQTAETGMLSKAGKEEEVVETALPVKVAKREVVVEPEDETEVEDNTYVGESRSVITR